MTPAAACPLRDLACGRGWTILTASLGIGRRWGLGPTSDAHQRGRRMNRDEREQKGKRVHV